jgi:predicted transcriptional regulator of viral defense system
MKLNKMPKMGQAGSRNLMVYIKRLGTNIFTTHDLTAISGKSVSTVVQSLNRLSQQGLVIKIYRGVWAESGKNPISPFEIIPYLFPLGKAYVSFISALHLHGIIGQIPQITLAALSHSRIISTKAGSFAVHQIAPSFFEGYDWYKGEGKFLIAEPEKALIDSLYLSSRKLKQYGYFPELDFPADFSFKKAGQWVERIPDKKIKRYVFNRLEMIRNTYEV